VSAVTGAWVLVDLVEYKVTKGINVLIRHMDISERRLKVRNRCVGKDSRDFFSHAFWAFLVMV